MSGIVKLISCSSLISSDALLDYMTIFSLHSVRIAGVGPENS
jgi:hypothetical protein